MNHLLEFKKLMSYDCLVNSLEHLCNLMSYFTIIRLQNQIPLMLIFKISYYLLKIIIQYYLSILCSKYKVS